MRIFAWIAIIPLAIISLFAAFVFAISLIGAPSTGGRKAETRAALIQAANYVKEYRRQHGDFPAAATFERAAKGISGFMLLPSLHLTQPKDRDFKFPEWPESDTNFAIGVWVGEWSEFYDSASGKTTLDDQASVIFWLRDALFPLLWAFVFGLPAFLIWMYLRKNGPNKAIHRIRTRCHAGVLCSSVAPSAPDR